MMFPERRSCVRHKVNGPVFASFDGVTGGMILDLSEQGLSMQTIVPLDTSPQADRRLHLRFDLRDSDAQLETTGYIAWADALGRAGVRFSDLPDDARQRLNHWLTVNDQAPSRKAPKLTVDRLLGSGVPTVGRKNCGKPRSIISLEAGSAPDESPKASRRNPDPIQYEFQSLGPDINSALRVIGERAHTLLRGAGAAIALADRGPMMCRATHRHRRTASRNTCRHQRRDSPENAFAPVEPCDVMTQTPIRASSLISAAGSAFARSRPRRSVTSAMWWDWSKSFPRTPSPSMKAT